MNSKESLKIQAVIGILHREEEVVQALGNVEDNFTYWHKLGTTADLLSEILEEAKEQRWPRLNSAP